MSFIFTALLFVIFVAVAISLYTEGLWGNALRLINVVTAALLATNFYEPLANWLQGMNALESYRRLLDFLCLWLLFGISMGVLRGATDYLSKVSYGWRQEVGTGKAVNWPVGLGSKGNPGVAGLIKYFPGAIGYVELGYALRNNMPVALLQNKAGNFIEPGTPSTSTAASVALPEDTRISITNTDAPQGYPLSSFTWILVFKKQAYRGRSRERAQALSKAFWWMVHEGQKYAAPLHYAPLPQDVIPKAENNIRAITYNGSQSLN